MIDDENSKNKMTGAWKLRTAGLLNTSEGSHRGSDWKTLAAWAITMLITNPQVNVYNLADETLQHKELVQQFDGS